MSLDVATGAGGAAAGVGFVGGLAAGFDIANFAGVVGVGVGGATGALAAGGTLDAASGAFDVTATAGLALPPFAVGALLLALIAGVAGS